MKAFLRPEIFGTVYSIGTHSVLKYGSLAWQLSVPVSGLLFKIGGLFNTLDTKPTFIYLVNRHKINVCPCCISFHNKMVAHFSGKFVQNKNNHAYLAVGVNFDQCVIG
jgi:hypothetical protein